MHDTPHELIALGYRARRDGRLQQAKEIFFKSVALCRKRSDPEALARSLAGLGQIERDLNNTSVAIQCYEEAVAIYRSQSVPLRLAHTIRHLADILREEGSLEEARP